MAKKQSVYFTKRSKQVIAILVALIVGALGVHFLVSSHAATPYATIDAAKGTLNGNATITTDPTATSGQAVQFGGVVPNVYTPPSSIPSDCSKDVAPALNKWIATVPSNSTIQFASKACY